MLKQVFLAHFESVLTEFSPFHHMYAPLCALCTYLGAVWWSHLELGEGCRFFALNGAFCGWPGRGERLLRAKLFQGGAGARNQVQSRAEYRCTLLSSSAVSQ